MVRMNGFRHWNLASLIFCFIDGLFIQAGVWGGVYLRFWGSANSVLTDDYLVFKIMLILVVIQTSLYFFDLYELKTFRGEKRLLILLLQSLGVSTIFLSLIYYLVPVLTMGRGIFAISLFLILLFTFFWRLLYAWVLRSKMLKERILIVGTGELAKKITSEILENGQGSFEIIGFIEESRERVGTKMEFIEEGRERRVGTRM